MSSVVREWKIGRRVEMRGPAGDFRHQQGRQKKLILVCQVKGQGLYLPKHVITFPPELEAYSGISSGGGSRILEVFSPFSTFFKKKMSSPSGRLSVHHKSSAF